MQIFKDNEGRHWDVVVNIGSIKRVRALCEVDILNLIAVKDGQTNTDLLQQIAEDPVLMVNVLYALCQPQAEKRGIGEEDFGNALVGDTIEQAMKALLEEVINFFPGAKRRVLRVIWEKAQTANTRINQAAQEMVDSPEFSKRLDEIVNSLTGSSASSPASSA